VATDDDRELFEDLRRVEGSGPSHPPTRASRISGWRHGLIWHVILVVLVLGFALARVLAARSWPETVGWLLIGVALIGLTGIPGLSEVVDLADFPSRLVVPLAAVQLVAALLSGFHRALFAAHHLAFGWFVLADGVLMILGMVATRWRHAGSPAAME